AIPAASPRKEAALRFIRFATQPEQQRAMARQGGVLPVLADLYDEPELREDVPVVALGDIAVRNARARPDSPIYSLLSPRLALMFERILQGEIEPAAAVVQTQAELRSIIERYAY
ncbi:MAG TPA: extracellular solute-binding protein, partial [Arenibaculum sp.]|nr:extracellular solute-binding protein [Arenibaculum sp.]